MPVFADCLRSSIRQTPNAYSVVRALADAGRTANAWSWPSQRTFPALNITASLEDLESDVVVSFPPALVA
jgi:hypothetical protein